MDKSDFLSPKYFLTETGFYLHLVKVQYFDNYFDPIWNSNYQGYKSSYYFIEPYKCNINELGSSISYRQPNFEHFIEIPSCIAEDFIKNLKQNQQEICWAIGSIKIIENNGFYIYPSLEKGKLQPRPLYLYRDIITNPQGIGSILNNRQDGKYECIELGSEESMSIYNTDEIHRYAEPISEDAYLKIRNMVMSTLMSSYAILADYYASRII